MDPTTASASKLVFAVAAYPARRWALSSGPQDHTQKMRDKRIHCRLLTQVEARAGLEILHEAYEWLDRQGIRQWTAPMPRKVYEQWQHEACNYGVFIDDELAAVFSLVPGPLEGWTELTHMADNVLWLHALAVKATFKHQSLGELAVNYAAELASNVGDELYLMCAFGTGFLPGFYGNLDFHIASRQFFKYGEFGDYDMVLMKRSVVKNTLGNNTAPSDKCTGCQGRR